MRRGTAGDNHSCNIIISAVIFLLLRIIIKVLCVWIISLCVFNVLIGKSNYQQQAQSQQQNKTNKHDEHHLERLKSWLAEQGRLPSSSVPVEHKRLTSWSSLINSQLPLITIKRLTTSCKSIIKTLFAADLFFFNMIAHIFKIFTDDFFNLLAWSCDVLLHLLKLVLPGRTESTVVVARVDIMIMMIVTMAMTMIGKVLWW